MWRIYVWPLVVVSVVVAVSLGGCAQKPRVPVYIHPAYSPDAIDSVTVLPIVDRRGDKSVEFDLEDQVRRRVRSILERRRYTVALAGSFVEGRQLSMEEVSEMDSSDLVTLGPANSRFLFVFYVEDVLSTFVVMAHKFKVELSATLLDKQNATVLWRNKCVATGGQAGLVGAGLSKLTTPGERTSRCLELMLDMLPKRPGRAK